MDPVLTDPVKMSLGKILNPKTANVGLYEWVKVRYVIVKY